MATDERVDGDARTPSPLPEPPPGTPAEVARLAWQVAVSASNAAAEYHASLLAHLVSHESKVMAELVATRRDVAKDSAAFKRTIVTALEAVGIHITFSASGEHAAAELTLARAPSRERVVSSHDFEEGLAEVAEQIEEHFEELRGGGIPSERVRELLSQERTRQEGEAKLQALQLELKTQELAHANERQRLSDQKQDLEAANARWMRVAFMIATGIVTVLGALVVWALTRQPPALHGSTVDIQDCGVSLAGDGHRLRRVRPAV